MGKTWQEITRGLPAGVYVHVVKEDPARRGLLFAGTERGVFDVVRRRRHWQSLQLNLPVTSMRDFEIYGNDLIVGDARPRLLGHRRHQRAAADQRRRSRGATAYLFKPADAINAIQGGDNGTPTQKDEPQAHNPPNGAYIDYYLKGRGDWTGDARDSRRRRRDARRRSQMTRTPQRRAQRRGVVAAEDAAAVGRRASRTPRRCGARRPSRSRRRRDAPRRVEPSGRRRSRRRWRARWTRRGWRAGHGHVHGQAHRERPELLADVRDQGGSASAVKSRE